MDAARPLSGREIARLSHMNHRSCLKALTRLEHIGFVNRNRGGRDHLFTINRNHRLWHEGILPMLEIERRHLGRLAKRGQIPIQTILKEGQVIAGKTIRELIGSS